MLDLTVNSNSERGLLGIALDKYFRHNGFVYLYWSETTQAADNAAGDAVPLMGNRLDRFKWDGTTLTYEKTLHRSRALQDDVTNRTNPAIAGLPRQPQRRRRPGRPGRQDLPAGRRHRPPRADAEPVRRPVRRGHPATTSSAARTSPTTT